MNEDMKKLFDKLPEGIILFNNQSQSISLINEEYKRLFNIRQPVEGSDNDSVSLQISSDCLNEKVLQLFLSENGSQKNLLASLYSVKEGSVLSNEDTNLTFQLRLGNQNESNQIQSTTNQTLIVSLSSCEILFQNIVHQMIMVKDLTPEIKCQKLKIENHFYEMLTATVSHDLRTPLNIMGGLLSNLDNYITDSTGKRFLGILKNSSKFMCFLVNDLLDFFQIKNGKFKKNQQWVDLKSSIEELVEIFKIGANEKGIDIITKIDQDFPDQVYADEQRIKQVILNLLSNSLKFTFQGHIMIEVSYNFKSQQLNISVADTGIGIKSEDSQKLFTLFGKLDATSKINTSGIGLGLSICKKIIEMFDGSIQLDESYIHGCKFQFSLNAPIIVNDQNNYYLEINQNFQSTSLNKTFENSSFMKYDEESKLAVEHDKECCDFQSSQTQTIDFVDDEIKMPIQHQPIFMKNEVQKKYCSCSTFKDILIVDDNIFNLVTLEAILQLQLKLQVDKATNGLEAVTKVKQRYQDSANIKCSCNRQNGYKLIFMDCNMPVMDGFQATQQIRDFEKQLDLNIPRSYITALTAYTSDAFQQKCLDFGMDSFLTKPIGFDLLRKIVKDQI
ncbi:pas domain s-box protein [Stylonychia lemnae]|uniref:Pas domain s-box protein n=1 Tax=Stylonychia lemnae TaxID=5949 RepID=A0A077ZWK3_STYLE|nr:pas domain s-box protein [Stylonychia lemnae]|eukprot:CDW73961.1 pas domain s-box protein [Stylonychia lemnae]